MYVRTGERLGQDLILPLGFGQPPGTVTVRDATTDVLSRLQPDLVNGSRLPTFSPAVWAAPSLADHHYIAFPPVLPSDLNFDLRTIDPDTEELVLEVTGVTAPQLFAVNWPRSIAPRVGAAPTPFLVYVHPSIGQNAGKGPPGRGFYVASNQRAYPFGWDYLFYGLWGYVNYWRDPLTINPSCKGLPYQISASGKKVVLVLPLNRHREELGVFFDAAWVELILKEIQAFMFRRAGVMRIPPLGRTALAAFSDGNGLARRFLGNPRNQSHPFYLNTLKELYMFDAGEAGHKVSAWVSQAIRWAGTGSSADKVIRAYTRGNRNRRGDHKHMDTFRRLLGLRPPVTGPFVVDSRSGLRTAAVLPEAAWSRAPTLNGAPSLVRGWQDVHQLISATMLTDALRRSRF